MKDRPTAIGQERFRVPEPVAVRSYAEVSTSLGSDPRDESAAGGVFGRGARCGFVDAPEHDDTPQWSSQESGLKRVTRTSIS